jgi:hypothetical protein
MNLWRKAGLKTKKFLFLLIFLSFNNIAVFSFSPKREAFIVWNYSSKNVVVEREFLESMGGIQEFNYMWEQNIFGMTLSISDMLEVVNTNVIKPNQYLVIINYFPLGPQLDEKYNILNRLPFAEKMKGIFTRLNIIFNDGAQIITLDDLNNVTIKQLDRSYVLEIFENNSERENDEITNVEAAPLEYATDFFQNIVTFFDGVSLPDGRIFMPENIPGYTQKEHQALMTHAIQHQGQFQDGNSQEVFEQLLSEAMMYFQGINIFRTRNPPYWYLEYEAQRIQNNALRILWN